MMSESTQLLNEQAATGFGRAGIGPSLILFVLWAAAAALSVFTMSWVETINAVGLLAAIVVAMLFWKGAAGARLFIAGIFVASAMLLSPLFHHAIATKTLIETDMLSRISIGASVLILIFFCLRKHAPGEVRRDAANWESSLRTLSLRLQVTLVLILLAAMTDLLTGISLKILVFQSVVLAAVVFALPNLLGMIEQPRFAKFASGVIAAALAVAFFTGAGRYLAMTQKIQAASALLEQDRADAAKEVFTEALNSNKILNASAPELDYEIAWAAYYEKTQDWNKSIEHWYQVAAIRHIDRENFLPAQRVLCKMGDSIVAWRKLVYNDFPSIRVPEIAAGIKALGNQDYRDPRAKLLAALLAWDQGAPPEERKRLLESVQKVSPGEPTSYNLLQRLGEKLPETTLWLPGEVLIGKRADLGSVLGTIEELGELRSLVALETGHWEMGVKARAVPFREEWPIIRVELDGRTIGRTQITRTDDHFVYFTFDVNEANLYHLTLVFENRLEDFQEGRAARRGLVVHGLTFKRD